MRKWALPLLILLIVGLISLPFLLQQEEVVYETSDFTLTIKLPLSVSMSLADRRDQVMENTADLIIDYHLKRSGEKIGTYSVVERTLGNGTTFIFERTIYNGDNKNNTIEISSSLMSKHSDPIQLKSWNPTTIEHEYHNVFGTDPTINPFGRISAGDLDMMVGNIYLSKESKTSYDHGGESVIRILVREVQDIAIEEDRLEKKFELLPSQIAESWYMVAQKDLFQDEQIEDQYIDFSLNNQTSQLNWLTADGPYTKLPFSIEPGSKMGYGRAIGRIEDDVALEWYRQHDSLFFESMVLNSRINLLYYINEFEGTRWPTEYTSTWLKNAYGITAPYVDTRYNEYVAFFLDATAHEFPDAIQQNKLYVPIYADYLISRVKAGEIIPAEDGYLIVDYFDEDPSTSLTHASLNHELGGLKILLTAYQNTKEPKYLETAENVIAGIETFGQEHGGWIRENGDLWYQARPDGTFSGDDYPQLTLLDLLETQQLLEEVGFERNPYFDDMIDSKLQYLQDQDIELIDKVQNLLVR